MNNEDIIIKNENGEENIYRRISNSRYEYLGKLHNQKDFIQSLTSLSSSDLRETRKNSENPSHRHLIIDAKVEKEKFGFSSSPGQEREAEINGLKGVFKREVSFGIYKDTLKFHPYESKIETIAEEEISSKNNSENNYLNSDETISNKGYNPSKDLQSSSLEERVIKYNEDIKKIKSKWFKERSEYINWLISESKKLKDKKDISKKNKLIYYSSFLLIPFAGIVLMSLDFCYEIEIRKIKY